MDSSTKKITIGLLSLVIVAGIGFVFYKKNKKATAPKAPVFAETAKMVLPPVSIGEQLTPTLQKVHDRLVAGNSFMVSPHEAELLKLTTNELRMLKKLIAAWPEINPEGRNSLLQLYARNIKTAADVSYFKEILENAKPAEVNNKNPLASPAAHYVVRVCNIMLKIAPVPKEVKTAIKDTLKVAQKSGDKFVAEQATLALRGI